MLAESSSPVMVFETGLPTRYYFNRTEVNFDHLVADGHRHSCPYKGMTSGYWSVPASATHSHPDLAWAYDFPTRQLLPIAGLISFYNEKVDVVLDGERLAAEDPLLQVRAPARPESRRRGGGPDGRRPRLRVVQATLSLHVAGDGGGAIATGTPPDRSDCVAAYPAATASRAATADVSVSRPSRT